MRRLNIDPVMNVIPGRNCAGSPPDGSGGSNGGG